jgi:hypothetical protein
MGNHNQYTHYYEDTAARRVRLDSDTCHGQALCSNGSAHLTYVRHKKGVTCPACLKLLKEDWYP